MLATSSLHDWLPADHPARFIAEVVSEPDLRPMLDTNHPRNSRPAQDYHPEMLTRLLL